MEDFLASVGDAYEHLYDMVCLRAHPLVRLLMADPALSPKDRASRLHQLLLDAIEELNPGANAPAFSREWRRHRLLVLRYVDGLDPQAVADEIGIGRRHYYREQQSAVEAVAQLLWERRVDEPAETPPLEPASRMELLRLEAERLARSRGTADLAEVLAGALSLLQNRLQARRLEAVSKLPGSLSPLTVPPNLLRQLLLSTLSYLIEFSHSATLSISAQTAGRWVQIIFDVSPPHAMHSSPPANGAGRLAELAELARLSGARLEVGSASERPGCLELWLPTGPPRTVLVIDDNIDVIELFRRYLEVHQYEVVASQNAGEALELARSLHPQAITLDLMMPDEDGWELLQVFLADPETRSIPIIICSVLRQRELALSLGAAAFLEKPITQEALLNALKLLE